LPRLDCAPLISSITRLDAATGVSYSQIRNSVQPRARNFVLVSASGMRLALIFCRQNTAFRFGQAACIGRPCQKQPSAKTAIFSPGSATSATRRGHAARPLDEGELDAVTQATSVEFSTQAGFGLSPMLPDTRHALGGLGI
jgi:hypothetical protein